MFPFQPNEISGHEKEFSHSERAENEARNLSPHFLGVLNSKTPSRGPKFRSAGTGKLASQAIRKQIISAHVRLGATD